MTKKYTVALSLAIALLVSLPTFSMANALPPLTGPETANKLNQFRQSAGKDFLLPQVFKTHPGITAMLAHAQDLALTDKQINKLKGIRRAMLNRSLAQMKKIDALRTAYLAAAEKPDVSPFKIHKDLHAIAWLMAQATADHLAGHLKAAKVLTKTQFAKLATLK